MRIVLDATRRMACDGSHDGGVCRKAYTKKDNPGFAVDGLPDPRWARSTRDGALG